MNMSIPGARLEVYVLHVYLHRESQPPSDGLYENEGM
jgi:hypothetical protein